MIAKNIDFSMPIEQPFRAMPLKDMIKEQENKVKAKNERLLKLRQSIIDGERIKNLKRDERKKNLANLIPRKILFATNMAAAFGASDNVILAKSAAFYQQFIEEIDGYDHKLDRSNKDDVKNSFHRAAAEVFYISGNRVEDKDLVESNIDELHMRHASDLRKKLKVVSDFMASAYGDKCVVSESMASEFVIDLITKCEIYTDNKGIKQLLIRELRAILRVNARTDERLMAGSFQKLMNQLRRHFIMSPEFIEFEKNRPCFVSESPEDIESIFNDVSSMDQPFVVGGTIHVPKIILACAAMDRWKPALKPKVRA